MAYQRFNAKRFRCTKAKGGKKKVTITWNNVLSRINRTGLKPWEWKRMTFSEFVDYEYGYEFRKAELLDSTRRIMWASLAAMGGKEAKQPKDLIPLWIDDIHKDFEKTKEKEYLSDDIVKNWLNTIE
jgi:hypothetical protein